MNLLKSFNQKIIAEFTNICPKDVVERVCGISVALLDECIDQIKQHVPIMHAEHDYVFVDEHRFGTSTVTSEISLFVVFKSSQLELNTTELVNNKFEKFKIKFSNALKSMKKSKRKRKKKKESDNQEVQIQHISKYSILNLKKDLSQLLVSKIDKESYIQIFNYYIKLVSPNTLGITVNFYPVLEGEKGYKLYNSFKNAFLEVDFKDRDKNFNEKYGQVGLNLLYMIRVFNNLYFSLYNSSINQIFIESLLYNVPNELFEGYSFYESFIKILNYLSNVNLKNFVSITDTTKKLTDEILIEQSFSAVNKFFNDIEANL